MRKEVWKKIKYKGVLWGGKISNMGRVKGVRGSLRNLQRDKDGYLTILLTRYFKGSQGKPQKQQIRVGVHRLVAFNFLEKNFKDKDIIIHLNNNRKDNWYKNLIVK